MSSILPVQTELDAVNEMLGSIGQAPVASLAALSGDPAIAQSHLTTMSRAVQLYGFTFNTDTDYVLSPDSSDIIRVPAGSIRQDPMDPKQRLVARKHPDGFRAFWDLANNTWTMGGPVSFRLVWGYVFDDLPDSAKNYVTLAAARRFQKRIIGSTELDGYNQEDEERAWSLLLRDERSVADTNIFRDNPRIRREVYRRGDRYIGAWPGQEVRG